MILIKKIFKFFVFLFKVNIIKTLYFNFKMLPFKQAIKLPIFLYGKIFLGNISGSLVIPKTAKMGMIRIGYKWIDLFPTSFLPTQIQIVGKLIFRGKAVISGGVNLNVQSTEGILDIGDKVTIGGGSIVKCLDKIIIGDCSRITGNCTVMDCNMHFVKNIETGIISNYKAPIIIGKSCWLNSGSIITKGASIPDYSISARNTFISKNYDEFGNNLFLVGAPAKVSSSRVQRIFSSEKQKELVDYFRNSKTDFLQLEVGIEVDNGSYECF